jgi:DMSO/TMAO reductase YedYZ molybdopterin-dependent catalytic subunit
MSLPSEWFGRTNRRRWGTQIVAAGLAAGAIPISSRPSRADEPNRPRLIVRNDRPLNLETPVELLDTWLTPIDRFFVRSHFGPPAVNLRPWSIRVDGMVRKPIELPLDSARLTAELGQTTVVAVLQCAGNGRALFEPIVPGVPWRAGAVGNAEWRGILLRTVLEAAGVRDQSAHVHFYGADAPPHPKTPAYVRSLPLDQALDPSVLLATQMNREPLPVLHGGPVRLIVPGWTGNHWMKWLRTIVVSDQEAPGGYQRTAYRIPLHPTPPDTTPNPEEMVPVMVLNVKSLVTSIAAGRSLRAGTQTIRGVAWTGPATVNRVDISIDDGPWRAAELGPVQDIHAWRQWTYSWQAETGRHTIRVRAADTSGQVQPEKPAWNKSGYLWNGIDTVAVEVLS